MNTVIKKRHQNSGQDFRSTKVTEMQIQGVWKVNQSFNIWRKMKRPKNEHLISSLQKTKDWHCNQKERSESVNKFVRLSLRMGYSTFRWLKMTGISGGR